MEIQYLNKLKMEIGSGYKFSSSNKTEGISELEISHVETQLGIQFPKAYKEFLFLAGEGVGFGFGNAVDYAFEWAVENFQEFAQERLRETGVSIVKPFWVYASYDSCELFRFFYLNEGDNPAVYSWYFLDAENKYQENGLPIGVKKHKNSFSDHIDFCIDLHKKGEI